MAVKLVVGTIVRLRSDSPWMTVVKDRVEDAPKNVEVAWFDGAVLHRERFPKDALVAYEEEKAAT